MALVKLPNLRLQTVHHKPSVDVPVSSDTVMCSRWSVSVLVVDLSQHYEGWIQLVIDYTLFH